MNIRYNRIKELKVDEWQKKVDDFNFKFVCAKNQSPSTVRMAKAFHEHGRHFKIVNGDCAYTNIMDEIIIPMDMMFKIKIPHNFYRI